MFKNCQVTIQVQVTFLNQPVFWVHAASLGDEEKLDNPTIDVEHCYRLLMSLTR